MTIFDISLQSKSKESTLLAQVAQAVAPQPSMRRHSSALSNDDSSLMSANGKLQTQVSELQSEIVLLNERLKLAHLEHAAQADSLQSGSISLKYSVGLVHL
jgi:uncharacterized protein YlxW (UPF0749 family)